MILARRQAHFFSFVILAILIPLCFLAGIWLRPSYNPVDDSAKNNELFYQAGFLTRATNLKALDSAELSSANLSAQGETFLNAQGEMLLQLQPSSYLKVPDPLLYWEPGEKQPTEISDRSLLLGNLSGSFQRYFPIPEAMQGKAGNLIIYSSIQQTIFATLPLPAKLTKPRNVD